VAKSFARATHGKAVALITAGRLIFTTTLGGQNGSLQDAIHRENVLQYVRMDHVRTVRHVSPF
jgi:hypothetical protein